MKIKYKYQDYQNMKRETARELWLRIATDFNAGMTIKEIQERYINPMTNKPYHRTHIYLILRRLRSEAVN